MGQAERIQEDAVVAGQATAKYRARGVPSDWYVDPADPDAADRYNKNADGLLEDQATAFLAAHEALLDGGAESEDDLDPPMELAAGGSSQPVWIGLPFQQDFDDEGELGWQTDALCAQTDPEAFSLKRAAPRGMRKKSAGPATCAPSALSTRWQTMNGSAFGEAFPSVSAGG